MIEDLWNVLPKLVTVYKSLITDVEIFIYHKLITMFII